MGRGHRDPGSLFVNLLGGFSVAGPGPEDLLPFERKKSRALLAVLALEPGRMVPRGRLTSLLWNEHSEDAARHALRQCLHDLRQSLERAHIEAIRAKGDLIGVDPNKVVVDVARFERHIAQGAVEGLEEAVALYRGDLLEGFSLEESSFEEWLSAERERLRAQAVGALRKLLAHRTKERRADGAQVAARLLTLEPFDEAVHRTLMRLYAENGRRSAALRQYETCVELLSRELGVDPEPETRELYRRLVSERPRPAPASSPPRVPRKATVTGPRPRPLWRSPAVTRLFGREADLEWLDGVRERAHRGQPQVALVIGEAGIGKSRLVEELASRAQERRVGCLFGRSREGEHVLAFAPWVEALRGSLNDELLDRLTPATRHDMGRLLPEIADGPAPSPSGMEDGPRIFEAVACVLRDLAVSRPLVVVIEDLHWSDDMTLRLLKFLPRRLDGRPVLLVGTVRPEEIASAGERGALLETLRRDGSCAPRTLGPLSRGEATQLFRALLSSRDDGPPPALTERVLTVSEGNPFVVVECARAVREGAAASAGDTLELPEQVRALTLRSLAGLGEHASRLADVAAVIGRDFDVTVLRRAADLTEAEVADGIEELVLRRVLREIDGRFDFSHDRVREVAHSRLLGPRRVLLHRQIAHALEVAYADDLGAHCAAIGAHYHRAGAWQEASDYLARAGFQAWARGASREALACFGDAIQALSHLPMTEERRELGVRVRLAADAAHVASGHFDRGLVLLREGESLAEALPDRRWAGRMAAALGQAYRFAGAYQQVLAFGRRALDIARDTADRRLEAEARLVLGQAEHFCGNFRRALDYLTPIVEAAAGDSALTYLPALRPMARYCISLAFTELGEFDAAVREVDELFREDEIQAHPFGTPRLLAYLGLGFVHVWTGDSIAALGAWEGARASYRDDCHRPWSPLVTIGLGLAYTMTGRVAEGVEMLERSDAVTREIGVISGRANRMNLLALGLMRAGRLDEATRVALEARRVASEHGERHMEPEFHVLLGEVARLREPVARTDMERHLLAALPLADELERRPLAARCHLRLAWLYKKTRRPESEVHRAAARELLDLMGGHFKLDAVDEEALAV